MLTGDNAATAQAIAAQVGIEHVLAEVLPADKAAKVRRAAGSRVTSWRWPATASTTPPRSSAADVGIAIGTGADVAIAASDITLVGGDLRGIVSAIALSRRTVTTMKQGLGWAFGYNLLLIPVAAGALYWWHGLLLDPVLASAAMAMSSVSVLTNALRLRRFRRPATAAEILHPPLRARIGQYAYLTGVAVVALALGAGLTAVSRMDFAEHGMNGQLAWTQGTGMPMRPAMSVMMTADVPATDAADAGLDVQLDLPADVQPGQPTRLVATIVDTSTGSPVDDLTRSHEAWMHLIATRADLGTFAHIHPEPTGQPGQLAVEITFPTAGSYIINTEFRRQGQMADVHDRQMITVAGPTPAPVTLTEEPAHRDRRRRPRPARRRRPHRRGERPALHPHRRRHRPPDRRPAALPRRRRPHRGHARRRARRFAHEHAEVTDADGRPVFALPGTTFGPELDVHAEFPTAGIYQLWAQFRLADGNVITAPFTVHAQESR